MSSEYYPAYCASKLFSANFENSMERWRKLHGRRVRLIWTSGIQVDRLTNTASLTTRREHARERQEKAIKNPTNRKVLSVFEQSYTTKSDITRKSKSKSKSRHTKSGMSSLPRLSNLRRLLSHNICSTDRTLQTRKLSVPPVRRFLVIHSANWYVLANIDVVKNKRNEKAAKFSVPLPKVGISFSYPGMYILRARRGRYWPMRSEVLERLQSGLIRYIKLEKYRLEASPRKKCLRWSRPERRPRRRVCIVSHLQQPV
jgi:hypothetical protein